MPVGGREWGDAGGVAGPQRCVDVQFLRDVTERCRWATSRNSVSHTSSLFLEARLEPVCAELEGVFRLHAVHVAREVGDQRVKCRHLLSLLNELDGRKERGANGVRKKERDRLFIRGDGGEEGSPNSSTFPANNGRALIT